MARRRSTRLLSQIHASEEATGMSPRRSKRLHPQTQSSADGAGATRRRRRRRRGTSAASLPDDDGMLWEILLRLPPQPSSLPRASAVCKRWRCIVGDPKFHRQFYAHHRKPPLLGVYSQRYPGRGSYSTPSWTLPTAFLLNASTMDAAATAAKIAICSIAAMVSSSSRTGRGQKSLCTTPSPVSSTAWPFRRSSRRTCSRGQFSALPAAATRAHSRTGIWGDLTFAEAHCEVCGKHSVLLGNCLYWLSMKGDIIELHLGEHSLTVIRGPPITTSTSLRNYQIIEAEHGAFGYALFLYPRFQMWRRDVNGHGVATWVPWKTIEMDSILKLPPQTEELMPFLLGYDDDPDAIFLSVSRNIYMVHLKSMQSRKLCETIGMYRCRPFKSFYTSAIRECGAADILQDP